jgi:hypothetical protein
LPDFLRFRHSCLLLAYLLAGIAGFISSSETGIDLRRRYAMAVVWPAQMQRPAIKTSLLTTWQTAFRR